MSRSFFAAATVAGLLSLAAVPGPAQAQWYGYQTAQPYGYGAQGYGYPTVPTYPYGTYGPNFSAYPSYGYYPPRYPLGPYVGYAVPYYPRGVPLPSPPGYVTDVRWSGAAGVRWHRRW